MASGGSPALCGRACVQRPNSEREISVEAMTPPRIPEVVVDCTCSIPSAPAPKATMSNSDADFAPSVLPSADAVPTIVPHAPTGFVALREGPGTLIGLYTLVEEL